MYKEIAVIREIPALENLLAIDVELAIEEGEKVVKEKKIEHLATTKLIKFLLGSLTLAGVEFEVIKPTPRDPAVIDLRTGNVIMWWVVL